MKNKIHLYDWLSQATLGGDDTPSIHLDRISDCQINDALGVDFARKAYDILNSAVAFMQRLAVGRNVRYVVLYLPLDTSSELGKWSPDFWDKITVVDEPPSLYLIYENQVFDDESEEYRCPIAFPFEDCFRHRVVFRSFRNQEAIEWLWEFTSGIYLIAKI